MLSRKARLSDNTVKQSLYGLALIAALALPAAASAANTVTAHNCASPSWGNDQAHYEELSQALETKTLFLLDESKKQAEEWLLYCSYNENDDTMWVPYDSHAYIIPPGFHADSKCASKQWLTGAKLDKCRVKSMWVSLKTMELYQIIDFISWGSGMALNPLSTIVETAAVEAAGGDAAYLCSFITAHEKLLPGSYIYEPDDDKQKRGDTLCNDPQELLTEYNYHYSDERIGGNGGKDFTTGNTLLNGAVEGNDKSISFIQVQASERILSMAVKYDDGSLHEYGDLIEIPDICEGREWVCSDLYEDIGGEPSMKRKMLLPGVTINWVRVCSKYTSRYDSDTVHGVSIKFSDNTLLKAGTIPDTNKDCQFLAAGSSGNRYPVQGFYGTAGGEIDSLGIIYKDPSVAL